MPQAVIGASNLSPGHDIVAMITAVVEREAAEGPKDGAGMADGAREGEEGGWGKGQGNHSMRVKIGVGNSSRGRRSGTFRHAFNRQLRTMK